MDFIIPSVTTEMSVSKFACYGRMKNQMMKSFSSYLKTTNQKSEKKS